MKKKDADKKILQYKQKIYGFALSKTRDYEQAQELAQEIICEVYISLLNSENIVNYDGYECTLHTVHILLVIIYLLSTYNTILTINCNMTLYVTTKD